MVTDKYTHTKTTTVTLPVHACQGLMIACYSLGHGRIDTEVELHHYQVSFLRENSIIDTLRGCPFYRKFNFFMVLNFDVSRGINTLSKSEVGH